MTAATTIKPLLISVAKPDYFFRNRPVRLLRAGFLLDVLRAVLRLVVVRFLRATMMIIPSVVIRFQFG